MSNSRFKGGLSRLRDKIILTFLVVVIIPLSVISIVGLTSFYRLGVDIANESGSALDSEETRALQDLSHNKAIYLNESFGKSYKELAMLANYAQDLFNGRVNVTDMRSYYHNISSSGIQPPGYHNDLTEYNRWISFDVSGYVIANFTDNNSGDYLTKIGEFENLLNISAGLDIIFRNLKASNPSYTWIYMGFEAGFHRSYPWHSYSSFYDPRARSWYKLARNHSGSVVFTSPYLDASGQGLMISIAKTITNESLVTNNLIGVISVDLRIETLRQSVLKERILDNGYGFVIDSDGNTIIHPHMKIEDTNKPITSLESNNADFVSILSKMEAGQEGFETYVKDGQTWVIAYYPISVTGYSMAIVVPRSDILKPAIEIRQDSIILTIEQLLIFMIVLVVAIIVIFFFVNYTAKRIVKPVKNLTLLIQYIQRGDLSRELTIGKRKRGDEISDLMRAFNNLTTILRFGNQDFYQGDLNRAFKNYQDAYEFFTTTGNKKGAGIALNNLGNVYSRWGDFENAKRSYEQSIGLAEEIGDLRAMARRMSNLASLYHSMNDLDRAEKLYLEALDIDTQINDQKGMAFRYRNLAKLYMDSGDLGKARGYLEKALQTDKEHGFESGIGFDNFYLGLWLIKNNEKKEAIEKLKFSLDYAEHISDMYLKLNILKELSSVYRLAHDTVKAHRYRAEYEQLKRKIQPKKYVVFIFDCSGSMVHRIAATKEGALYIFDHHVNPQDVVAIIIFHSIHKVLLPPIQKAGNEEQIRNVIYSITNTVYETAFYDALGAGIDFLNESGHNEQKWIVALTDGIDNCSSRFTLDKVKNYFFKPAKKINLIDYINENLLPLNLIIIGVGNELAYVEKDLRGLVDSVHRGLYIPAATEYEVNDAIKNAFKSVGELLAEMEVEKFDIFEND
ncbi:MAG: cache domain-containing protein [Promethearchaeota archaeon]